MPNPPGRSALRRLRDNPTQLLHQLKPPTAHHPTVDGHPEAILQNPAEYQRLLDLAAEASAKEGSRQGLADLAAGPTRTAREVFDQLR